MIHNLNFRTISEFLQDLFFPKECVSCGKEGEFLCKECEAKIVKIETPTCFYCGKINDDFKVCKKCKDKEESSLTGIIMGAYYGEGPIKKGLINLKYKGIKGVAENFAKIQTEKVKEYLPSSKFLIMPVPAYRTKKYKRGYNQAEVLAKHLAKNTGLPINEKILKKTKDTQAQVFLSGQKRRENLSSAFDYKGQTLAVKNILLVDDVITTGVTLEACAKELKKAGAKSVWAVVVAKD